MLVSFSTPFRAPSQKLGLRPVRLNDSAGQPAQQGRSAVDVQFMPPKNELRFDLDADITMLAERGSVLLCRREPACIWAARWSALDWRHRGVLPRFDD